MKILHCADIHLDSKMENKLSPDQASERRTELVRAMPSAAENIKKRCIYMNDFVKPKDQREFIRFGLARNRTFKNVFDKREQRELARYAEWRTDERS